MKKTIVCLVLILSVITGLMVPALTGYKPSRAQSVMVCGQASPGYKYYFPIIRKAGMMNEQVIETLEGLLEQPVPLELDAQITAVFEKTISARIVTSGKVRQNIPIPGYINKDDLQVGQNVRLGLHNGVYILLAAFDEFADEVNYSGLGYPLPTPPAVTVFATRDGWRVQWNPVNVPGTRQRDVSYHVYINDTPTNVSPTDVGVTSQTSMLIGYDGDPPTDKYVAVSTIANGIESDVSAWVTDSTPPPLPDTFSAINATQGHQLTIAATDQSLNDQTFRCWEIEVADDASGTNNTSLGYFTLGDFPNLQTWGRGTVKYYRIRSIDWVGNTSDWTNWDRAYSGQSEVKDLFDGYGGELTSNIESLYWLQVSSLDETGWKQRAWLGSTQDATPGSSFVEGNTSYTIDYWYNPPPMTGPWETLLYYIFPSSIQLDDDSRFSSDDDFVCFSVMTNMDMSKAAGELNIVVYFHDLTYGEDAYAGIPADSVFVANTWTDIKIKKSAFSKTFGFDWSTIDQVTFWTTSDDDTLEVTFDDLRIVKADPDDATTYNDTGNAWDKATNTGSDVGQWHIYEGNRTGEPSKPYSYGQVKIATSPSVWYLSHKPISTTDIISGTVQTGVYLKDADSQAGLAFFVKDATADSWDMYVVEADSSADTITLAKYVAGTRTQIAQAGYTINTDQILWLGADFRDYDSEGGRIRVYASDDEGNLIQASNMRISAQDNQWAGDAGGSVGLLSYQANVRFVNFSAGSPAHAEMADFARLADKANALVSGATGLETKLIAPDGSPDPALSIDNNGAVDIEGKQAFRGYDTWLRMNPANEFSSGTYTPNLIRADGGFKIGATDPTITKFDTDGTLAGNSDNRFATQKAVKTYVDNNAGGGVVEFIRTSDLSIPATSWTWLDYDVTGQSAGTAPVSRTSSGVYTAQFEGHFSLDISYQFYHSYTGGATFYYFVYIYDPGSTEQVRMTGTFDTRYSTNTKWGHKAFSFYMGAGWYVRPRIYLNQATAGNIQPSLYTSMQFGGIRC